MILSPSLISVLKLGIDPFSYKIVIPVAALAATTLTIILEPGRPDG